MSSSTNLERLGLLLDLPISFIACLWIILLSAAVVCLCGPWYETKVTACFDPDSSALSDSRPPRFLYFRGMFNEGDVKIDPLMSSMPKK